MLLVNFRVYLSFTVLHLVCCHAQTLESSQHGRHGNTTVRGIDDGTRCSWNCTDIDSYLMERMKTIIVKNEIVRIVVKYEVMGKCTDQIFDNSSENITEHLSLQIWRANKQASVFTKALESVVNLISGTDSVEHHKEIRAICTLRPANTTAREPTHYNKSSPIFSRSHLPDHGIKFDSIDCNTETTNNLQPCINITKSTENKSSISEGLFKRSGWPVKVLVSLLFGFVAVFTYYSFAFLCLFSPTEVTEDGVHQIVLDGASPVSFRSLIGNYFFSKEDTIRQRLRMFILRGVVIPFPFLVPAIFAEYLQQNTSLTLNILGVSDLLHPIMLVSYVCFYIMVCFMSFSSAGFSERNRPCFVCRLIKSKTIICQENLPKGIRNHLRIQPLILVECSKLFIRYLSFFFEKCFLLFPSTFEFSPSYFLRLFLIIVLLSASPAVTILLFMIMVLLIFYALLDTSPILTFYGVSIGRRLFVYFRHNRYLLFLSFSVCITIVIPGICGALVVLIFAGIGVEIAIVLAFVLLLNEESLPFVALSVLVLYYFWSSYSSFTTKYQDLGLALFKHYKSYKSRHSQVTDMSLNTDSLPENSQNYLGSKDNLMKIPKELFRIAYEELMPIRESVCVLILKVTLIVSFVAFVFSLIMLLDVSATPVMRALLTFLSGSLPKVVAIYIGGRRQKNIESMAADEKISFIVQEYLEGTSTVNQEQTNSGVDVDEEMLQNENEENIELRIM